MTFNEAVKIAKEKEGYELCKNPNHGYMKPCTYANGKTALAKVVICPIINFGFSDTYLFHSKKDFVKSSEKFYKLKGLI